MNGHVRTLSTLAASALVFLSGGAAVAGAVVLSVQHDGPAVSLQRPAGIPATVISLMRLAPVPRGPAPGFTLTDQDGRVLSLSDFRGKAVILEFVNSRGTGVCPLISRQSIDAYRGLGGTHDRVVFVAVNVNERYNRVADVLAYSRAHALTATPDWYFLTGAAAALRAVWREYGIAVTGAGRGSAPPRAAFVYFIGPHGNEHYTADPAAGQAVGGAGCLPPGQVSGWARGIAQVTAAMLR